MPCNCHEATQTPCKCHANAARTLHLLHECRANATRVCLMNLENTDSCRERKCSSSLLFSSSHYMTHASRGSAGPQSWFSSECPWKLHQVARCRGDSFPLPVCSSSSRRVTRDFSLRTRKLTPCPSVCRSTLHLRRRRQYIYQPYWPHLSPDGVEISFFIYPSRNLLTTAFAV